MAEEVRDFEGDEDVPAEKLQGHKVKCPICKKKVSESEPTFPFCSARCRQIDLGKWLSEDYRVSRPIEQPDLDET